MTPTTRAKRAAEKYALRFNENDWVYEIALNAFRAGMRLQKRRDAEAVKKLAKEIHDERLLYTRGKALELAIQAIKGAGK